MVQTRGDGRAIQSTGSVRKVSWDCGMSRTEKGTQTNEGMGWGPEGGSFFDYTIPSVPGTVYRRS